MLMNESIAVRRLHRTREAGVAAVEFAIILPLMITLIAFPLFFGRVFMFYSVAQKSAHNSAIYLSKIPLVEMQDVAKSAAAATLTSELVAATIEELHPGSRGAIQTQIDCDDGPCGTGVPTYISVHVRVKMYDELFNFFTSPILGDEGIQLKAKVTMKYVGT
jgi:hypothetical protein